MSQFKTEPIGFRKEIGNLVTYVYGQSEDYANKRKKIYRNRLDCLNFLIYKAIAIAKGEDLDALQRAYPAKYQAMVDFQTFMKDEPKNNVDEFFFQWGFKWDFDKNEKFDLDTGYIDDNVPF